MGRGRCAGRRCTGSPPRSARCASAAAETWTPRSGSVSPGRPRRRAPATGPQPAQARRAGARRHAGIWARQVSPETAHGDLEPVGRRDEHEAVESPHRRVAVQLETIGREGEVGELGSAGAVDEERAVTPRSAAAGGVGRAGGPRPGPGSGSRSSGATWRPSSRRLRGALALGGRARTRAGRRASPSDPSVPASGRRPGRAPCEPRAASAARSASERDVTSSASAGSRATALRHRALQADGHTRRRRPVGAGAPSRRGSARPGAGRRMSMTSSSSTSHVAHDGHGAGGPRCAACVPGSRGRRGHAVGCPPARRVQGARVLGRCRPSSRGGPRGRRPERRARTRRRRLPSGRLELGRRDAGEEARSRRSSRRGAFDRPVTSGRRTRRRRTVRRSRLRPDEAQLEAVDRRARPEVGNAVDEAVAIDLERRRRPTARRGCR